LIETGKRSFKVEEWKGKSGVGGGRKYGEGEN
jgi:hypothetical protein